jgi:hypothetical protein
MSLLQMDQHLMIIILHPNKTGMLRLLLEVTMVQHHIMMYLHQQQKMITHVKVLVEESQKEVAGVTACAQITVTVVVTSIFIAVDILLQVRVPKSRKFLHQSIFQHLVTITRQFLHLTMDQHLTTDQPRVFLVGLVPIHILVLHLIYKYLLQITSTHAKDNASVLNQFMVDVIVITSARNTMIVVKTITTCVPLHVKVSFARLMM